MTAKEKAWQAYCEAIMPTRRDYVYPLQGAFYKAFCAGYDAAQRKEWAGLTHEVLLTEKNRGEE